jgi:hypothetical protein
MFESLSTASFDSVTNASGNDQVAVVVLGVLVLAILFHIFTRWLRAQRSPGSTNTASGRQWPWSSSSRGRYSSRLGDGDELSPTRGSRRGSRRNSMDAEREMANQGNNRHSTASGGIDRNTSVRSVMTLPAYSPAARENERILGREGERGGIDVVVEFPETQDEEETRREEEMESLYQIRLARRAEAAEREDRRRQRREARARGDLDTLAQLRERQRSNSETVSNQLIAEHQLQDRSRRVSSVQYADLGVARHDGSRVRANSSESDHRPLLDSAASISGHSIRPTSALSSMHNRGRSASSVLSVSTMNSEDYTPAHRTVSHGSVHSDFEVVSLSHSRSPSVSRSIPNPTGGEDLADQPIPQVEPPDYDQLASEFGDAPPYSSPVQTRAPQLPRTDPNAAGARTPSLPHIERLPSIRITESAEINHPRQSGAP